MTKKAKLISFLTVAILISGFLFVNNTALGVNLTQEQITLVQNNCISAKSTLNQIHSSDTLLRVNSGQNYESLSTKLMKKFNERLLSNGYNDPSFSTITTSYEIALGGFRANYIAYEEQMTKAINIDCSRQPEAFYEAADSARTKRAILYSDVAVLNQKIEDYKKLIAKVKLEKQPVNNETKQ